jgi:hypothetical protein
MAQRRRKLNVTSFSPLEKSIRGRVAEFLHWAMKKYPYQILTYEEVTQAIFGLGRAPQVGSKHVKSVRGGISSAAKLLMEKYKTSLVTLRGVGVRAAVDDTDILRESVTKDAERHRQTAAKLMKTAGLVSPEALQRQLKELKGDPKMKEEVLELSKWFNESLSKYVKSLEKPQATTALLPPPPPT